MDASNNNDDSGHTSTNPSCCGPFPGRWRYHSYGRGVDPQLPTVLESMAQDCIDGDKETAASRYVQHDSYKSIWNWTEA